MQQQPTLVAGIDIGGTNVRCAVASAARPGAILVHRTAATPAVEGPAPLLDFVAPMLVQCLAELGAGPDALAGIGCAIPGFTDAEAGVVVAVSNLRGWRDVPLGELLARRFGAPVAVENDVNAAALGEYHYGVGAAHDGRPAVRSLVYMTISTGVAAGIVLDGRLWRGRHHAAGELGFMLTDPAQIGKDWEGIGCLELTSAGVGLGRAWAALRGGPASPTRAVEVFDAARAGDPDAAALVGRAADYLAMAVVAVGAIVDPDVVVLGGSIAEGQPSLVARIREVVETTLSFPPEVRLPALRGDAPIVGALYLAREKARPVAEPVTRVD